MIQNPPFLLVHGAGGGAWEWSIWLQELRAVNPNTHAIELQSHEHGLRHTQLDHYLDQVINFAHRHQLRQPIIFGSHMGAVLAIKAQRYLPSTALVLLDPLVPVSFLRKANSPSFPEVVELPKRDLEYKGSGMPVRRESGLAFAQLHATSDFQNPNQPCLIILAENDSDTPAEAGNELAEWLKADVISYAGMDHIDLLLGKRAKDIAGDALEWISKLA